MSSSRIFVRGLPPTISENDFRKHFSARHGTTDVKVFANRRIGYVGYKSPEDAAAAVRYFNRTYMKMSRLAVELARPVSDSPQHTLHGHPTAPHHGSRPDQQTRNGDEREDLRKRKRGQEQPEAVNAKLEEYMKITKTRLGAKSIEDVQQNGGVSLVDTLREADGPEQKQQPAEEDDDDEYESMAKLKKAKTKVSLQQVDKPQIEIEKDDEMPDMSPVVANGGPTMDAEEPTDDGALVDAGTTDADWLRSKTSRLLGLLDDDEEGVRQRESTEESEAVRDTPKVVEQHDSVSETIHNGNLDLPSEEDEATKRPTSQETKTSDLVPEVSLDEAAIRDTRRLFLRNLEYNISEDDLRAKFSTFGNLEEAHVPMDNRTGKAKGTAYLQFAAPEAAVEAWKSCDGQIYQGRLLHILPAVAKRETQLDEFEISKLPLKRQNQIRRKMEAGKSSFSWNSLYMNADAVMSSVSDRLGVDKAALLDPTSSDAAVKQAIAETHVINETKSYFAKNGVDLEAFKRSTKGDTTILVKNFNYGTQQDELRRMFEEHGQVVRMLMPPSGTIAIVEFSTAPQARAAFASLAYRKLKDSVLFLERAPKDLFKTAAIPSNTQKTAVAAPKKADELLQSSEETASIDTATLFVSNLNFVTTSKRLADSFKPLAGFLAARVKTKTNPNKPQELLSMGFGFLEFRSKQQAQAAVATMDGYTLDGHRLVVKASQKNLDAAEERRRKDKADRRKAQKSKVVIKNLPFETSKKDIRALLQQYGQLRTIRLPKKFDNSARGFAFAEFTTPQEAANAIDALRNTHLLGRKMVMDYAEEDPEDAEAQIEKIAQRVADKSEKVSLQKLIGGGRRKFEAGQGPEDEAE